MAYVIYVVYVRCARARVCGVCAVLNEGATSDTWGVAVAASGCAELVAQRWVRWGGRGLGAFPLVDDWALLGSMQFPLVADSAVRRLGSCRFIPIRPDSAHANPMLTRCQPDANPMLTRC
jgi:hypothetical protein